MELNQELSRLLADALLLAPEYILIGTLILILLVDLLFPYSYNLPKILLISGVIIEIMALYLSFDVNAAAFNDMIRLSGGAAFWKILLAATTLAVPLMNVKIRQIAREAEMYILVLGVLIGANFLIMSTNLLMIYLSLEIVSICSYLLVMLAFDKRSSEAGLKYLLFGGAASAVMLYGMTLLYAQTGTLALTDTTFINNLLDANTALLITSSVMIVAGLLFKLAAVPMHIWAPDVYTGAPTPIVAFFSIVPKLAGLGALMQILLILNLYGQSEINWTILLSIIAMLSMLVGNFSALWQTNVKRMLAYSSIAQTGFLLAGIAAFSETSYSAVYFYSVAYAIANLVAFAIVHHFEIKNNTLEIKGYAGAVKSQPIMVILLLIAFLSLTGLPPIAGFTGKLLIFTSVWESYQLLSNEWLLYLLVFGLFNTVVALFYYLKIPYHMIFKTKDGDAAIHSGSVQNFLVSILVLMLLLIFFRPDWLMGMINNISFTM